MPENPAPATVRVFVEDEWQGYHRGQIVWLDRTSEVERAIDSGALDELTET